jgi:hypothetical protein
MEALGIIFPGARITGVRTTRPTLPSRRLVRPILEMAHRAAGLDLRAYHGGDDDHEEDMEDLPGIEGDGYWNISDDGSEWEDVVRLEEDDEDERFRFNGDDDDEGEEYNDGGGGAILPRRGDGTAVPAAAVLNPIRGAEMPGADGWEVVERIGGTSRQENAAGGASEAPIALGGGYQTNFREAKAKRPKSKGNERARYWTLSLARPHRTASTRKSDKKVKLEQKPDSLEEQRRQRNSTLVPLSASKERTKQMEAVPIPGESLASPSQEQPPSRLTKQDSSDTSSQDGVYLQAQQAAFEEFIRIAESADESVSSLVSVSTPTSRNLSSVLGTQNSFNSVDSGKRISLARMSGRHQQLDFKPEFIHHWLKAQREGRHFRKRPRQEMFGWNGRRQDAVARD